MRRALVFLLLASFAAFGHARTYEPAELEGLLAPVALYPDSLVSHILVAASYPDQVAEAARGTPPAPHWHPSVTALLAYPEILRRMAESPQWMHDLAEAHLGQQAQVLATLDELRGRANAYGQASPPPAQSAYVYRYGPTYWQPWPLIGFTHFHHHHRHHRPHVRRHAPHVTPHHRVPESRRGPIINSTPGLFNKPRSSSRPRSSSGRGLFRKPR